MRPWLEQPVGALRCVLACETVREVSKSMAREHRGRQAPL